MNSPGEQRTSWTETTTRVERKRFVRPAIHKDGDWSSIETITVTVVHSGSEDTMPGGGPQEEGLA
ncbi:hypothetical protein ABZX75_22070 [Streptomyces sp. NPDC003038]|uniref:hypothetical protein n=1 Tax=unclassified Streptomyces TaxID=2593676 RepID=UPI0033A612B5